MPLIAGPSPVRYHIEARLDGSQLEGRETVEIESGEKPLSDVVLFLFPNVLRERMPFEDSKSFFTLQPVRWRPGGMELTRLETADGTPLAFTGVEMVRPDGLGGTVLLPTETAVTADLPQPVHGVLRLRAEWRLTVPERFGSFSCYRDELFLSGGWYPMVAPRGEEGWRLDGELPRSDVEVSLDAEARRWLLLDGAVFPPEAGTGSRRQVSVRVVGKPEVPLVAADVLRATGTPGGISLLQLRPSRSIARRELRVAGAVREFLEARGLADPVAPLTVLETPLSRELAFHDLPFAAVSSRIYRLFTPMRKYHDLHLARAVAAALVRDRVYALEPGDDAGWVLDAVAWQLARQWEISQGKPRDVRDYARPFGFLPAIDVVLYNPDFPFAAEYYDDFYFTDVQRDDVRRFNHLRPNGRVVYEKLVDLLGEERISRALEHYLSGGTGRGFRETMTREAGRDLGPLFDRWRAPLPRVNYALQEAHPVRLPDGRWAEKVEISREGDPVEEPVQVKAHSTRGDTTSEWWSGEGESTLWLPTAGRPGAVALDPRGRLLQTDPHDDRIPPSWHLLLDYAYAEYDFTQGLLTGAFSVEAERTNDLRTDIDLTGFHQQQSTGFSVGYVRSAGPFTYYRGLKHRVGFYLVGELLNQSFGANAHLVGSGPAVAQTGSTLSGQCVYRYDDRDDWRFSRSGSRWIAALESGISLSGATSRFTSLELAGIKQLRLSDNNVLAGHLDFGTFLFPLAVPSRRSPLTPGAPFAPSPSEVPASKLFSLGGQDQLRGISPPDYVGPTRLLLSGEWRNYFWHDLDIDFWLGRVRGLQGALFTEGGYVSARTDSLPPISSWVSDVGYGLRVHYDTLGVRPMLFSVDLAQRVDDLGISPHPDLRLYLGASQSF